MSVSLVGYQVVVTVLAVAVVVAAVAAARVGSGAGARGALLDGVILATGITVTCWVVSVTRWPGQGIDVAAVTRTAAAIAALGLVVPAVLAARHRARLLIPVALAGHVVAQAGALGPGPVPGWGVLLAGGSVALGVVALAAGGRSRGGAERADHPQLVTPPHGRGDRAVTAASSAHVVLLAASWVAAPTLLVVLQAAGVSVSPRPLIVGWVAMVVLSAVRLVDLSARFAAQRAERDSAQRFRGAFEQSHQAMALVEIDGPGRGRIAEANDAMYRVYGVEEADLVGRLIESLVGAGGEPGGDAESGRAARERRQEDRPLDGVMTRLFQLGRIQLASEVALSTSDGRDAWGVVSLSLADGAGAHRAVLRIEDVTERRTARDQLDHLSLQDPLTGLANRRHLHDRMAAALARAERSATPVAVVLVDLDRFAAVNERYGPGAGDEVLVEVGSRLRAVTRPADTIARLGADHFAVLLGGPTGISDAMAVADRICSAMVRPYHLDSLEVAVAAAVGVALAGAAPHALLEEAQLAVDRAKLIGSATPVVYDDELRAAARDRAGMADDLRTALTGTGLRVVYQPVVAVPTGAGPDRAVTGWEATLRWDRHTPSGTDRELLPGEFFGVAEQCGLLLPIGYRVLEIALAALQVLPAVSGGSEATMTVNLSHRQLARPDAAARVLRAVETARVDARRLCVEIDEGSLPVGGDDLMATLRRLRQRGVTVAVGAFGTGHMSLSALRRLPADIVKIDASLVAGLDRGDAGLQIVAGLVQLASGLGLRVVAEGVETADGDRAVQRLGIHAAQGRYYGAPEPAPWPSGEPSFSPLGAPRRPAQATPGLVNS